MIIVYLYCLVSLPFAVWQMISVIKEIKRQYDKRPFDWSKEK